MALQDFAVTRGKVGRETEDYLKGDQIQQIHDIR